jgi:ubiquinol-cytochrome c reductase cytochrome b subunit
MLHKVLIAIFVVAFVVLGYLGMQAGSTTQTWIARILTVFYFGFFLTMPIWSAMGKTKEVPARVPDHE